MTLFSQEDIDKAVNGPETELCKFMKKYGSDKASNHHNYSLFYDSMFRGIKNNNMNVLEIGIGSVNPNIPSNMCGISTYRPGASIRGWADYFPNSVLYACDIDRDIIYFPEPRINGFFMDQTNSIGIYDNFYNSGFLGDVKFDIIVDDGLHDFKVNMSVLHILMPKVKKGGYYIVEDIINFDEKLLPAQNTVPYTYQYIRLPNPYNNVDNNILVCKKN